LSIITVQVIIPAGAWQSAMTLGDFSLAGCVVAPAFEFAGFEMAPEGWSPELGRPSSVAETISNSNVPH